MEYKILSDIYSFCYDVLTEVAMIADANGDPKQLLLFLTVDNHEDENCFGCYPDFDIKENYSYYKKIMMSMLLADFYMNELHDYEKDIIANIYDEINFDTISANKIIKEFYSASAEYQEQMEFELSQDENVDEKDSDDYLYAEDFEDSKHPIIDMLITDFIFSLDCNFTYCTESVDIVMSQPRALYNIMRINPLFPLIYLDLYLEMDVSEKMVKNFRDVYDSMVSNTMGDKLEQQQYFIHKLESSYKFDYNKAKNCILYIFSSIYGYYFLTSGGNDNKFFEHEIIKKIHEKIDDIEELVAMFYNDEDFFLLAMDDFLVFESDFYKGCNLNIHMEVIKTGDEEKIKVFKKCNVLYDEEEKVIQK